MTPFQTLDPVTLHLTIALFSALLGGLCIALTRVFGGQRAVLLGWAWTMGFAALAFVGYFLRGHVPAWMTQPLANLAGLAVPVLALRVHLRWQQRRMRWAGVLGVAAIGLSGPLAAFAGLVPMWVAVVSMSAACGALGLATAWLIASLPGERRSAGSGLSLLAFTAFGLVLTLRAVMAAVGPDALPMESNAAPQLLVLFVGSAFVVCSTLGIVLMVVERQRQLMLERAQRDALTGVLTRGAFIEAAQRRLRSGHAAALLMIDVDHFKRINDAFGHAGGDRVLAQAAQRIAAGCRADDLVGRYGGEEFCVLLGDAGPGGATELAQRLVHGARGAAAKVGAGECRYTISIGHAACAAMREPAPAATLAALFDQADRALYAAKRAGRDRAAGAEPAYPHTDTGAMVSAAPVVQRPGPAARPVWAATSV
jgi:diguanylate cyclase (GGDEF)-like protein